VTDTSPPALFDIGINLAHDSYDADRGQVLRRALDAGVGQLIVTGSCLESTERAITLVAEVPRMLRCTAGVHPHHASSLTADALETLARLAADPAVVAVGECGLDYHRNFSPREAQREAFHRQLELATRLGKPLFLHQRDAHDDFMAILREHGRGLPRAVAHCFTGTREQLLAYLDMGLWVGITGWICDERRGHHLKPLVGLVPAGRLMIETDGPYLLPRDLVPRPASRRNEPAYLSHVARIVAADRGESFAALATHTTRTAREFFDFPPGEAPR
jgi:TatD DNase family protein